MPCDCSTHELPTIPKIKEIQGKKKKKAVQVWGKGKGKIDV
jgi:hypothetical protein